MNIRLLLICMIVTLVHSAKICNAYVTDDAPNVFATDEMTNEHKNNTCALTEDELDEVLGGLEELEHLLKKIKSAIDEM